MGCTLMPKKHHLWVFSACLLSSYVTIALLCNVLMQVQSHAHILIINTDLCSVWRAERDPQGISTAKLWTFSTCPSIEGVILRNTPTYALFVPSDLILLHMFWKINKWIYIAKYVFTMKCCYCMLQNSLLNSGLLEQWWCDIKSFQSHCSKLYISPSLWLHLYWPIENTFFSSVFTVQCRFFFS